MFLICPCMRVCVHTGMLMEAFSDDVALEFSSRFCYTVSLKSRLLATL